MDSKSSDVPLSQVDRFIATAASIIDGLTGKLTGKSPAPTEPSLQLGHALIPFRDLTAAGMLVSARVGCGTTSRIILPTTEQFLSTYPDAGGMVLDTTGEHYSRIVSILDKLGRNTVEEVVRVSAGGDYPVVRFEEVSADYTKAPSTVGRYFYVSAVEDGQPSEASLIFDRAISSLGGRAMSVDFRKPDLLAKIEPELLKLKCEADESTRFLGWRREGKKLVRVSHTTGYHQAERIKSENGSDISVEAPRYLRYAGTFYIKTGVCINLVDNRLNSSELADHLATVIRAGAEVHGGGDNSYWFCILQKVLTQSINLLRFVFPQQELNVADIYRLLCSNSGSSLVGAKDLISVLEELGRLINNKQAIVDSAGERASLVDKGQLEWMKDVRDYFCKEYVTLDAKIMAILKAIISNAFASYLFDPVLHETFCKKSTIEISDAMKSGKIFIVGNREYEGECLKMGITLKRTFQRETLLRVHNQNYDHSRRLLLLDPDFDHHVIFDDDKYLSLSREPRLFNLFSIQNFEILVGRFGRDKANCILAQFGVYAWGQNFNPTTNELAAQIIGDSRLNTGETKGRKSWFFSKRPKAGAFEGKLDLSTMKVNEFVIYDGISHHRAVTKDNLIATKLTSPHYLEVSECFRDHMQAIVEQAAWKAGRTTVFDPAISDAEILAQVPSKFLNSIDGMRSRLREGGEGLVDRVHEAVLNLSRILIANGQSISVAGFSRILRDSKAYLQTSSCDAWINGWIEHTGKSPDESSFIRNALYAPSLPKTKRDC